MKTILALFGGMLLLQACAYPISKDLVERTDKAITFEMLRSDPDRYKGKTVILGGSIVQVTVLAQGSLIEVTRSPLDYWGKPIRHNRQGSRFVVYSPAYVDPDTYAPQREITVAGEVKGTVLRVTGLPEMTYSFPVIISREIKLWPNRLTQEQPEWLDPLYNRKQSPVQPQY